mmetsp:Transcript_6570/g.18794  ORF Transcript_6570/g.18794 Transcript_6570/m.18794 type:complete len:245 (+) Transcript_6570:274-1008(+)
MVPEDAHGLADVAVATSVQVPHQAHVQPRPFGGPRPTPRKVPRTFRDPSVRHPFHGHEASAALQAPHERDATTVPGRLLDQFHLLVILAPPQCHAVADGLHLGLDLDLEPRQGPPREVERGPRVPPGAATGIHLRCRVRRQQLHTTTRGSQPRQNDIDEGPAGLHSDVRCGTVACAWRPIRLGIRCQEAVLRDILPDPLVASAQHEHFDTHTHTHTRPKREPPFDHQGRHRGTGAGRMRWRQQR